MIPTMEWSLADLHIFFHRRPRGQWTKRPLCRTRTASRSGHEIWRSGGSETEKRLGVDAFFKASGTDKMHGGAGSCHHTAHRGRLHATDVSVACDRPPSWQAKRELDLPRLAQPQPRPWPSCPCPRARYLRPTDRLSAISRGTSTVLNVHVVHALVERYVERERLPARSF